MGLSGVEFQGWVQQNGVNNGFPIFENDPRYDPSSVQDGGGDSYAPPANSSTILHIDGADYAIGHESRNGVSTTATVDQGRLAGGIAAAIRGSSVRFPVSANDSISAQLVLQNIEDMARKNMTLTVQTGGISYALDTAAVDTEAIMEALGTTDADSIAFSVGIRNSSAVVDGATLVLSPVEFIITCTYNGRTVTVDTFASFVSRSVEITAEQAEQITTAVVVAPDGSLRHVPTRIEVVDGRYYAVFGSLTNSTYALIQNKVEFSDATTSWAKDAINDMGSRMIVSGVGDSRYEPGRDITRAEFSAIMVRALGLDAGIGEKSFSDVGSGDWYGGYIETAVSYGLITGYGDGRFGPNDKITREQAMAIIARAMVLTELRPDLTEGGITDLLTPFADGGEVSGWSAAGIAACLETGVVTGRSDTALCPKENITRAEVAVIVQRLLQKSGLI
jgi:hypothetical protein